MSDSHAFDFGKFIPGFDFLQKLATQRPASGGAASALGGWVAPTVSVDELDRRVKELKAVQFWLEQNTTAIKATVQALEVQKMTLATLQGMNLSMAEITRAFTLPTQDEAAAPAAAASSPAASGHWPFAAQAAPQAEAEEQAAPAPAPVAAPEPDPEPAPAPRSTARPPKAARQRATAASAPAAPGLADPVQWWGALTQQFQQIAANALRDAATAQDGMLAPQSAPEQEADSAASSSTPKAQKGTKGKAAAKRPAKKTASPGKAAARKAPAKKAAAKKRVATARAPAAPAPVAGGWPLPPPFKLGR